MYLKFLILHSVNSDWLFNTQSRVLQADWLMLENDEKATLNINMPYFQRFFSKNIISSHSFNLSLVINF